MTALILAVLLTGADIDAEWDKAADTAIKDRKCAKKKTDPICAELTAFRSGTLPPELGAKQFGLAMPHNIDDGKAQFPDGTHLVLGSAPLLAFNLKPDNADEKKAQVELAAAWLKPADAPKGSEGLISFVQSALKPGTSERATRTEWIQNPSGPGGFAVRMFEKRLYVMSLRFDGTYEKKPGVTIASMGLSPP